MLTHNYLTPILGEGQEGDESWMPILHSDDLDRCHKRWYESVRSGDVYERLKEADRAKGEFLANISHELHTPMNAIIGMTDLALGEDLASPVRDFLSTARGSADVLLGLFNEILDFSRLESGKLVMESAPFGLRSTLDETIKTLAVKDYEKGLELACDVSDDVPEELVGDPLRLKQVLLNLIGNAVKFTERGEIVLRLSVESKSSGEVCLRFAISDTGIGISPDDQQLRLPSNRGDSWSGEPARATFADSGHDGSRHARRSTALFGSRNGCLSRQADRPPTLTRIDRKPLQRKGWDNGRTLRQR